MGLNNFAIMNGLKYTVIAIYSFAMGAVMANMQWPSQISESIKQESEPFGNIKINNNLRFKLYKNIMLGLNVIYFYTSSHVINLFQGNR